ncbi:cysteine synthase [Paraburkholderia bannensis]|uniref:Cysteine synthase n=1 Tax=Paraburkholderia bannensis TaxID=765414 RepID=A0A7W9WVW0_9BURK|nr:MULTISPECIES: hypothetical protein [Paraburkholderia]MBB3260827.1 cysteine synthase [Paraburkholderia sp. WP4_3_2]MBB6105732.1 cysteine synthase [Paraburkholderia bannensis]
MLVAPVGSGGSNWGIAAALREAGAQCTLISVDLRYRKSFLCHPVASSVAITT